MMRNTSILFVLALSLFTTNILAQQPPPPPKAKPKPMVIIGSDDAESRPGEMRLVRPSLKDELNESELEPRMKKFRMNIRFLRAEFTRRELARGTVIHQQYDWTYFPEAAITILFYQYPFGRFSLKTPADARTEVSNLIDTDLERVGAKKLSERDLKIGNVLGRELEVSLNDKVMKVRTFTHQDIRYVLIAQPKTDDAGPLVKKLFDSFEFVPVETGASIESGVFTSKGGGFSLAISEMPFQTIDSASETAITKGVDAGKQFVWKFDKTLYTAFYTPPVDKDGNAMPPVYEDMITGTRKGVLRSNVTMISEKPISFGGKHRGTEFRYISTEGVRFINRTFLVGDTGYQIVGGYSEDKYEKEVLDVLDSFKLLKGTL